jgi:hypothetical protein
MDSSESSGEDVHEMIVQYVTEVLSEDRKKGSSEVPCEGKVGQRDICEADSKVDLVVDKNVKVESCKRAGPWKISLELDGRSTEFEVDTGSAVTLISKTQFTKFFPNKSLSDSKVKLETYSGEKIKLEGEFQIEVKYNKSYRCKLYVTNEQGSPLMGRDWLMKIHLNWRMITCLYVNKIYQTNDE